MKTEERLRAALQAKADTATPSPTAFAEVQQSVSRRRGRGWTQVAVAATATAVVAAGTFALVDRDERRSGPPANEPSPSIGPTSSPTPSSSPTTAPDPTASATPSGRAQGVATTLPGGVPAVDYVALLDDGRLVAASSRTGAITAVLARLPDGRTAGEGDLALSPDRRTVWVPTAEAGSDDADVENESCPTIVAVDVTTGATTEFATGSNPQISPDGRRLAFEADCEFDGRGPSVGEALVVRDVVSGREVTYVNDDQHGGTEEGPWRLADLAWHADSKRVWVAMDWEDAPELRLLDPASDRTLRDAEDVRTQHYPFDIERRGDGLAFVHLCCYPEFLEDEVIYLRSASGAEREAVRSPTSANMSGLQVGPDGSLLYTQNGNVYRMDPETGETNELGRDTAAARDW